MAYELAPLSLRLRRTRAVHRQRDDEIHHDKHHQTYVNNLNAALANHPELAAKAR